MVLIGPQTHLLGYRKDNRMKSHVIVASILAAFAAVACTSEAEQDGSSGPTSSSSSGLTAGTSSGGGEAPSGVAPGGSSSGAAVAGDVDFAKLPAGSFAVQLDNNTRGSFPDDKVFISIVGVDAPGGHVTYAMPTKTTVRNAPTGDGTLMVVKNGHYADNSPPSCIPKNGQCYANYSFTLADLGKSKTIYLPGDGKYYGTRIYVSLGEPLYQQVNEVNTGLSQLNLQDPNDPNFDVPQDWFELTYDPLKTPAIPFGGNVTQVDMYSIPMAFDVVGVKGTTMNRGITMGHDSTTKVDTQAQLVAKYQSEVAGPFKNLLQKDKRGNVVRFIAPYHGKNFQKGGADEYYFSDYVNDVWRQFTENPSSLYFNDQPDGNGNRFAGCEPDKAHEHQICFLYKSADKKHETGPWYIKKPTTLEVLQNGGALQPGCKSTAELNECNAFGAQLAAALNRGVAKSPKDWLDASKFYQGNGPMNHWAKFWHEVSLDKRAYGMGFDDTGDQSSVAILPVEENVAKVRIGIGW